MGILMSKKIVKNRQFVDENKVKIQRLIGSKELVQIMEYNEDGCVHAMTVNGFDMLDAIRQSMVIS